MILPDKQPLDFQQLNEAIAALGFPGFTGTARLSRNSNGNRVSFYILIKIVSPTRVQEAAITTIVSNHVPIPIPSTRLETIYSKLKNTTLTDDETSELLRLERGL